MEPTDPDDYPTACSAGMNSQLSLALAIPSGAPLPRSGPDRLLSKLDAAVSAIPMVGHAKGTARESIQRPVG